MPERLAVAELAGSGNKQLMNILDKSITSISGADDKSGRTSLNRIQAGVRGWVPGQTMYLTNSLPYAQRLESGWSGQAPAGMVKVTIANFQSHFAQALGEVR